MDAVGSLVKAAQFLLAPILGPAEGDCGDAGQVFGPGAAQVGVKAGEQAAVPLIVGRALQLPPEEVAFLISADLFVCGIVSIIQSLGATQYFGIKLPVMMGVTFASVGPMVAVATSMPGHDGARALFGAIIAAGIIGIVIAPFVSRMLRFFPPVVTGTLILTIGISLMPIGINWIFGLQVGPTAPKIVDPEAAAWVESVNGGNRVVPTVRYSDGTHATNPEASVVRAKLRELEG